MLVFLSLLLACVLVMVFIWGDNENCGWKDVALCCDVGLLFVNFVVLATNVIWN